MNASLPCVIPLGLVFLCMYPALKRWAKLFRATGAGVCKPAKVYSLARAMRAALAIGFRSTYCTAYIARMRSMARRQTAQNESWRVNMMQFSWGR